MKLTKNGLYLDILRITGEYLGPAAQRFVDRQIENHLEIEPTEITAKDLKRLISWIRIAVSLLTEDISLVNNYCEQLENLTKDRISKVR